MTTVTVKSLEERVKKLEKVVAILVKDAENFRAHKATPDAHHPAMVAKIRQMGKIAKKKG